MLKIKKRLLNVEMSVGAEEVNKAALKIKNIDELILVCDTRDSIVYCSKKELDNALNNLPIALINEFNINYSISEDIHDCIEADELVDDIVFKTIDNLKINVLKYFYTMESYCTEFLINRYNLTKIVA